MKIDFQYERETKNTYRFFELDTDGKENALENGNYFVGTLYVRKELPEFKGVKPERITVEISMPRANGRKAS